MPVVGNLLGSMSRIALALNTDVGGIRDVLASAAQHAIPPITIEEAPVHEHAVIDEDKIDLQKSFPILTHAEQDAGPYITAGIWSALDPDTGRRNNAYIRTQIKGPNRCGLLVDEWRDTYQFLRKAEAQREPLECSIALGVDPVIEITSAMKVPGNELALAGAIRNQPVRLVNGVTVKVQAIADAEIIIEGRILPSIREDEGPFGEFTGQVSGINHQGFIFNVTGVFHRKEPIYRALYGGSNEHVLMGNVVPREPAMYDAVRRIVPSVKDVHIAPWGVGFIGLIAIEKQMEGEPRSAMFAAWASHVNLKYIIVVDHDVNIYDPKDVFWAIATRVQGQKNYVFIPKSLTNTVDPSKQPDDTTTKVGIDATVPLGELKKQYQRLKFKDYDTLRLDEYISPQD